MNLTQMNMMYDPDNGKLVPAFKINDAGKRVRGNIASINQTAVRVKQGKTRASKGGYNPLFKRAYHDASDIPAKGELYPSVVTGRYRGA